MWMPWFLNLRNVARKRGGRVYKDAVSASETAAFSAVFLRER